MSKKAPTTKPRTRDANGYLLAEDGLPEAPHARAKALADKGRKSDPLGRVPDSLIATYAPAPATQAQPKTEKE